MTSAVSDTQPPLKRASFTFHVCSIAGLDRERLLPSPFPLTYTAKLLDDVLDLFDNDSRFQYLTLDGETKPLEDYLSVRPENFERIEQAVQEGRLLIGPLYVSIHPIFASREALIRNLIIGLRTARAFGQPMLVGYVGKSRLQRYMPQIFRSFGFDCVLASIEAPPDYLMENIWKGDDGTTITLAYVVATNEPVFLFSTVREQYGIKSRSGQLMAVQRWEMRYTCAERFSALATALREISTPVDDSFHSNPAAYRLAIQQEQGKANYDEIQVSSGVEDAIPMTERLLTHLLEPFIAWADCLPPLEIEQHIRKSQHLLQKLWKQYLEKQAVPAAKNLIDSPDVECYHLSRAAMNDIAQHIDTESLPANTELVMVIFNPNPYAFHTTVEIRRQTDASLPIAYDTSGSACFNVMPDTNAYSFEADIPAFGYICYPISAEPEEIAVSMPSTDRNALYLYQTFTNKHSGMLPHSASLLQVSETNFNISAIKLPEDFDRTGLIVRGYNTASEPMWITLTPFRPFAVVEVVTMDEVPTGGQLAPEANGAITFRALPQHILTFWFHD